MGPPAILVAAFICLAVAFAIRTAINGVARRELIDEQQMNGIALVLGTILVVIYLYNNQGK